MYYLTMYDLRFIFLIWLFVAPCNRSISQSIENRKLSNRQSALLKVNDAFYPLHIAIAKRLIHLHHLWPLLAL